MSAGGQDAPHLSVADAPSTLFRTRIGLTCGRLFHVTAVFDWIVGQQGGERIVIWYTQRKNPASEGGASHVWLGHHNDI